MNDPRTISVRLADEADTDRLGRALAGSLPERALVTLTGPLGAGKTRLVRAIAAAVGVPPTDVTSPTFVLCHEYQGDRAIVHIDGYRLAGGAELLAIGFDEYLRADGWTLLEWPSRVASALPPDRYDVELAATGDTERLVTLRGLGRVSDRPLHAIRNAGLERPGP